MDCKDKVLKFYHFKRKVKEVQKQRNSRQNEQIEARKKKKSKVVHNIVSIVENYSEKCSISSIKIDANSRKLIIESSSCPETRSSAREPQFIPIASTSTSSPTTATSTSVGQPKISHSASIVKQEPIDSDNDDSLWEVLETSSIHEISDYSDIVVKEEPEEQTELHNNDAMMVTRKSGSFANIVPRNMNHSLKSTISTDEELAASVSRAALKMRAYRERLKRPENRNRYLHHKKQQREWNRRHYMKKQMETGHMTRPRRRQTETAMDFNEMLFNQMSDGNKYMIS